MGFVPIFPHFRLMGQSPAQLAGLQVVWHDLFANNSKSQDSWRFHRSHIQERKGQLKKGFDADLVIFAPDETHLVGWILLQSGWLLFDPMQMQCNVKLSPLLHLSQFSIALFSKFQNFPVNLTKWFVYLNNGTAIIDKNNACLPLSVFTSLIYYIFNLLIIKQFSRKILRRKLHQVEVGDIQHKNKLTPYLGRKLRGVVYRFKKWNYGRIGQWSLMNDSVFASTVVGGKEVYSKKEGFKGSENI